MLCFHHDIIQNVVSNLTFIFLYMVYYVIFEVVVREYCLSLPSRYVCLISLMYSIEIWRWPMNLIKKPPGRKEKPDAIRNSSFNLVDFNSPDTQLLSTMRRPRWSPDPIQWPQSNPYDIDTHDITLLKLKYSSKDYSSQTYHRSLLNYRNHRKKPS